MAPRLTCDASFFESLASGAMSASGNRAKVFKPDGKVMFTCKAWNGRLVAQWLHELLREAELRQREYLD